MHQHRARMFLNQQTSITTQPECSFSYTSDYSVEIPHFGKAKTTHTVSTESSNEQKFKAIVDGKGLDLIGNISFSSPVLTLNVNNQPFIVQLINRDPSGFMTLQYKGSPFRVKVLPQEAEALDKYMLIKKKVDTSKFIIAPMPGMIKSVSVTVGQMVVEGQEVCVIEAMKMQNSLSAARSGKIKKLNCKAGETVDADSILVELE